MTVDFIYNIGRDSADASGFSAYLSPCYQERMSYMMKKAPLLMVAALAALTLTGSFLVSSSVEAADKSDKATVQQEQQAKAPKKLKPWEEKYYELHPEAKKQDEEKANPSKHHSSDDDENWHRL